MYPLVSVIIPVWNREETIEKCIKSVLDQDYDNLEVLVCDDASTDKTYEIVAEVITRDSRVRWIGTEEGNSGRPAVPRNRGVNVSKGEYLAFLDSDDYWKVDKLTKQMAIFSEDKSVVAVCSNASKLSSTGEIGSSLLGLNEDFITLPFSQLTKENLVICSSMVVKKDVFSKLHGFPESMSLKAFEDYCSWLKIATLGKVVLLNQNLLEYTIDSADSVRDQGQYYKEHAKRVALFEDVKNWLNKLGREDLAVQLKDVLIDHWYLRKLKEFKYRLQARFS